MSITIQKISALAKKIYKANPKKKWVDCIKLASKQLKSGKVGDYRINKAEFSEKRAPTNPRKKTQKKVKKFTVIRSDGGQFEKIKRISGTGDNIFKGLNEIGKYKKFIDQDIKALEVFKDSLKSTQSHNKPYFRAKIIFLKKRISDYKKIVTILKKSI